MVGLSYGTVDQLIVGYRTDKNDAWHTLLNFTEATGDWETVTVALPNPSATYQIVFNGIGHDGEGDEKIILVSNKNTVSLHCQTF